MQSRADLLKAISQLPARTSLFPKSQKQNWITWLSEYKTAWQRKNTNRNARFIYNALNNSDYIIWLAASVGVAPSLIRKAIKTVRPHQGTETQAAVVRSILPWNLVATHLVA